MATGSIVSVVATRFNAFLDQRGEEGRLFAGLRDNLEILSIELQKILSCLTANARENTLPETWLADIICAVYTAEDCLDKLFLTTAKRKKRSLMNRYYFTIYDFAARKKLSDEIKRIVVTISSELLTERRPYSFRTQSSVTDLSQSVDHPHSIHRLTESYVAEQDNFKSLESRLLAGEDSSELRVISIIGMGGIGKTTLARAVYNSKVVIRHFHCRVWIVVGSDYNSEVVTRHFNFLNSMLASITLHEESLSMEQKKRKVYKLLEPQRYLIVLDDVWDVEDWLFLRAIFPDKRNGSRVLLTTRDSRIALEADPAISHYVMKLMSNEKGWELFLQASQTEEASLSSEQLRAGMQIVKKCKGVPLAVKTMGCLLRGRIQSIHRWETLLQDSSHGSNSDNDLTRILLFSYDDLDSHLRPLFLYFLIFRIGYKISVRRLFGLWLAEDLVAWEDRATWEDSAHYFLAKLIGRNMIQVVSEKLDGKPKTCQLHNAIREAFLSHGSNIGIHIFQNNDEPSSSLSYSYARRLVEYADIKYHSSLKRSYQNSRSYISFNFRKGDVPAKLTGRFLDKVIQNGGFQLLRVLDLERVYKPNLPKSLGKLYMLRYLGLRWTFLDAIPSSVGDLSYLETLDVKHTSISRLPNSIWKLRKLQHLYLNETHLNMPVDHISVEMLHTLLGLSIDMENPLTNKLYSLITIKRLGLTFQGAMDLELMQWISRLNDLQTLRLRSRGENGQPSELKLGSFSSLRNLSDLHLVGWLSLPLSSHELPHNLTVLTLSVSRLELDPMPLLEKLPKLRALRLFAQSYTGKEMVCSNGGFPSLCVLKLWMLEELETWSVESGAMVKLEELEIRNCKRLQEVPLEMLQLVSLRDLILTNMSTAFIAEVERRKGARVRLTLNNWEFPTFALSSWITQSKYVTILLVVSMNMAIDGMVKIAVKCCRNSGVATALPSPLISIHLRCQRCTVN